MVHLSLGCVLCSDTYRNETFCSLAQFITKQIFRNKIEKKYGYFVLYTFAYQVSNILFDINALQHVHLSLLFWWYHRQWLVCRIFTSYETTNYPRHSTHRFQELLNFHMDYYLLLFVLTVISNNSLLLYCYFTSCPHPCNQVLDRIVMQRFCYCWFKSPVYPGYQRSRQ